jgi:hypothetical protein
VSISYTKGVAAADNCCYNGSPMQQDSAAQQQHTWQLAANQKRLVRDQQLYLDRIVTRMPIAKSDGMHAL